MNYETLKLDNQLCFLFYSVSRAMTRTYTPLLEELELTYPQYLVMLVLWEKDNVTVNRITELLHMDTGTVSPLLKRLEKGGLVVRKRSEEDERKVIISLSDKGQKLKDKAVTVPEALFCKSGISEKEYLSLKKSLATLLSHLEGGENTEKGSC